MSRIKGRYVATIEINIDAERTNKMLSIDRLRDRVTNGELTRIIGILVNSGDILAEGQGTITVTQQYAEIHEEDEDGLD